MIDGIGIDIIEVDRIATSISRDSRFTEMVFSRREINYCETKANKFEHYAARFAAKEAFLKAIGTGWAEGTIFNEIEIINNPSGKPELVLLGETQKLMASSGINKILVSLSHLKTMATAVVIIEK